MKSTDYTDYQGRLIKRLGHVLIDIASEAEVDNNFNNQLAELGIFKIDILEMVQKLYEDID